MSVISSRQPPAARRRYWIGAVGAGTLLILAGAFGATPLVRPADAPAQAFAQPALVMIAVRDATTGNQADVLCRTTRDHASADALIMDAETAREVLPALCQSTSVATSASDTN
jgi:hypothetical protein